LAARAWTTADRPQSQPLDRMRQQRLRRLKKLPGVRQGGVQFKRCFVDPFGMNRKHKRFPNGLEYINSEAARLGAGGSINPKQLFPKFGCLPWQRLESDDHVKGQETPPAAIMVPAIFGKLFDIAAFQGLSQIDDTSANCLPRRPQT